MQLTRPIWRKTADLLAADVATLAAVASMHVHLASNSFSPTLDLDLSGVTECTFMGSAPLDVGTGAQTVIYDALDGLLTIVLKDPVGGFVWHCTVAPATPEQVAGIYLTDNADTVLYGSMLLDAPVTIAQVGDGVIVGDITLKFRTNSPF